VPSASTGPTSAAAAPVSPHMPDPTPSPAATPFNFSATSACPTLKLAYGKSILGSFHVIRSRADDCSLRSCVLLCNPNAQSESCFQRWYSEQFLQGDSKVLPCKVEWRAYRKCVQARASVPSYCVGY
jgi:hypothetical protein